MGKKKKAAPPPPRELTVAEEFYIANHVNQSPEELANLLNAPLEKVKAHYEAVPKPKTNPMVERGGFAQKRGAVVATQASSAMGDAGSVFSDKPLAKPTVPTRNRGCFAVINPNLPTS